MTAAIAREHARSVSLRTPQSVAAALPHLMGFHPQESLICLWLREREILVVQRADLPPMGSQGWSNAVDADEYVDAYLEAAANIDADEVLIACVTRHYEEGRQLVRKTAEQASVRIRGCLLIAGGRVQEVDKSEQWIWISVHDRSEAARSCGTAIDERALPRSRRDVVAEVEFDERSYWPCPESVNDDVKLQEVVVVLSQGQLTSSKVRRALRDAALTARGRDLIMWWCARSGSEHRKALMQALIVGLQATREGPHVACAVAALAWMCGDGVRANAALDRCLREDPHHVMGRMVESAMTAALPPAVFALMLAEVEPAVVGVDTGLVDESCLPGYSQA